MEHSISLLLGLLIVISFAVLAISYVTDYAQNININNNNNNDDNTSQIISHAQIHRNSNLSVISLEFKNVGDASIHIIEISIPGCTGCDFERYLGYIPPSNIPRTEYWVIPHDALLPENVILDVKYTFWDKTITYQKHKLSN